MPTPEGPRGLLRLLREERAVSALCAARALSVLGDNVTVVALMIYIARSEMGGTTMGLVLLAEIAPSLLSPWAGVFADRYARRRLLVTCEIGQGVVAAAMAIALPRFSILLGMIAARSALASVAKPGVLRAVPMLVDARSLGAANALVRAGEEGAGILGPLLAALLVSRLDVGGLFAVDAATFGVAGLLLLRLPRRALDAQQGQTPEGASDGPGGAIIAAGLAGLSYIARHAVARAAMLGLFGFVLFAALENVARPFLVQRDLSGGDRGVGLLYASPQVGLLIGFIAVGRWSAVARSGTMVALGMAIFAAGSFSTSLAPSLPIAMIAQFAAGVGNGVAVATLDTLLQRRVDGRWLGRVFANVYGGANAAAGLAYALGGGLLEATSPRAVFAIAGAGALAAALMTGGLLASARRSDGRGGDHARGG